ncbi:MAG: sulfotransferase [Novosphingobium sp.]|uniref:tetratricopeptide repeat-containing sulfotransferase family protein n=1 Tax=Novosphingobium sp. TaxID=1874826 RepID=UPI0032BC118E
MSQVAPPETFNRILVAARSQRFDEAAIASTKALVDYPDDDRILALGGAIELRRGQFQRAIDLLEPALAANPDDSTIRANLAEAKFQCGAIEAALALCDAKAIAADKSSRLLQLAAYLAQENGDHERAVEFYSQIVELKPSDWSSWNNLGNSLRALCDYPRAIEALVKAAQLQPSAQAIRINLANAYFHGGDPGSGEALLREAARLDPSDPVPLRTLFDQFSKIGRDEAALEAIREAVRLAPDDAEIHAEHGREAAKHTFYEESEAAYRTALRLRPDFAQVFIGLASNFERANQEHRFEELYEQAKDSGTDPQVLDYIDAMRLRRERRFEEAFAAIERAGELPLAGHSRPIRGAILDRLERYDEAFETFQAMNVATAGQMDQPLERARQYVAMVKHSIDRLSSGWFENWPEVPSGARPAPAFIGSFPRSGTTLLDTMLMGSPNVLVLEEQPFIALMEQEAGGLDALDTMSESDLAKAREAYWQRVAAYGPLTDDTLVIDKQPLHTNNVPAIKRLFPDARFILAMRHPCDVLLSCYITNFRTNAAMANFLTLADAAALYDLTFKNWEKAAALFKLQTYTIAYERLVDDPDRELRPLFDWLDLHWSERATDHTSTARSRGVVRTASYAQVTEPIYQRSRGRWQNYRQHLEPILPILAPWAEKFGYSLEDGRIPGWPEGMDKAP